MKKILTLLGINCLIFILIIAGYKVDLNNDAVQDINVEKLNEQIKNNTYYDYNNNDIVDVTIVFTDSSLLDNYYNNTSLLEYINSYEAMYLQEEINKTQNNFINKLESNNVDFLVSNYYDTLFNGISGKLQYKNIEIIEQYTEVEIVLINEVYSVPETQTLDTVDLDSTGIYDTSELEYKGDKMIVAVIDSGFNVAHSVFSNDVDGKYDRNYISSTFNSSYYYSSKLPFIYDYANNNYTVDSTIEHGQHVAGIIAGNDSVITGVAPNAQLALMKVANDNEIILDSCIYSALEDAIKLGVDSINISLGSPGGFSSPQNSDYVNELYESIIDANISLCIACGNNYSSAYGNNNDGYNTSDNPDYGIIATPSSYTGATTVASCSSTEKSQYIKINEKEIYVNNVFDSSDNIYSFSKQLGLTSEERNIDFISVPNYGDEEDYSDIDVKDKFVLVQRGIISFEAKVDNAVRNNAIGVIIYDTTSDLTSISIGNDKSIPVIALNKEGSIYLSSFNEGTFKCSSDYISTLLMSSFSSWGPLPSLEFEPDITAPGGSIYSSITNGYATKSGTSMASPNLCGLTVLTKQYINDLGITNSEATMISQLLMSTTSVLYDVYGNPYSVRKQGSGLADIYSALSTKAYLSVAGETKTKIELFDDYNRTRIFEFEFILNNISEETLTYDLNEIVMSDVVENNLLLERTYVLNSNVSYSGDGVNNKTVSVSAKSSSVVKVKIKLSNEDIQYLEQFENGMYVEGFIFLGDNLSIPFLGFYGDWTDSNIFDNTIYDEDYSIFPCFVTATINSQETILGQFDLNYDEDIYGQINANINNLSIPTLENVTINFYYGLIRGVDEIQFSLVIDDKYISLDPTYSLSKSYYNSNYGVIYYGSSISFAPKTFNLENNDSFEIVMEAKLDYHRESTQEMRFKITIDTEKPVIEDYNVYKNGDYTFLEITLSDNHLLKAIRPTYSTLYIPVFKNKMTIDITNHMTYIESNDNILEIYIYDYASNYNLVDIEISNFLKLNEEEFSLDIDEELDLSNVISNFNKFDELEIELSNDTCILENNIIIAKNIGECIVTVKNGDDKVEFKIIVYNSNDIQLSEYSLSLITRLNLIELLGLEHENEIIDLRNSYKSINDFEQYILLKDFETKLTEYEERMIVLKKYELLLTLIKTEVEIEINKDCSIKLLFEDYESLSKQSDVVYSFSNENCNLEDLLINANVIGETILTISIENVFVEVKIIINEITPTNGTEYIIYLIELLPSEVTLSNKTMIELIRTKLDEITDENQLLYLEDYISTFEEYEEELNRLEFLEENEKFDFNDLLPDDVSVWMLAICGLLVLYLAFTLIGKIFLRK